MSLVSVGLGSVAMANPSDEQGFLNKINAERSSRGLPALTLDTGLRSFARDHTQFMIDGGCAPKNICHSADLGKAASGWSALGENVGRGSTVESLHNAFMNSDGHRKNILDSRWNYVGIGADYGPEGHLYVTVVFMQKGNNNSTTTTTKPKATTTTKPKTSTTAAPTTTTTTLPPTTTTTLVVGPDKPVTPGGSCLLVTRFGWICQD